MSSIRSSSANISTCYGKSSADVLDSAYGSRIKWQPTVFTFSLSSKELKAKDALAHVRSRLEDLDIKAIIPYAVGHTTHVVQSKRNTAKGLQALVNGKPIVQDSYLDAVVYAATPNDLENLESLSPLEADFDSAWPKPAEHLPPPGNEPVHRPAKAFAPNPSRSTIFEGYTFVFGDQTQFDNLHAPITNAHGKALRYEIGNGVTTAEEIVQFMRNAAGYKGLGTDRDGAGGVVLVRFRAKGNYEEWSIELSNQVALMTDQRVIEQSEFLDAILANDASPLCRPLPSPAASQAADIAPNSTQHPTSQRLEPSQHVEPSQQSESSQPKPKPRSQRGRNVITRMKTFDDGFDIDSIPAYTQENEDLPQADEPMPEPAQEQPSIEEEDSVSSLLPGAAAMKRRRAESGRRTDTPTRVEQNTPPKPKRQKLDVLQAARQHREAEEGAERERRQAEDTSLQASLKDGNVEKLRNLAIVEEMEIPPREPHTHTEEDNRWDERWNGRKNFKRFRRKGGPSQPRHRIQTVIVPLEEMTRQEGGYGDHHWVTTRTSPEPTPQPSRQATGQEPVSLSQTSARVESQSSRRSQKRVREVPDSDSEDELRFRFRRRR